MRATDLCFRSPKEPNPPFRLDPSSEEFRGRINMFKAAYRWSHGSIYEIANRTAPHVGPGCVNLEIKTKKPCAVIKPSYVEEITGFAESKFEIVNGMRILQVCNLKKKDQAKNSGQLNGNAVTLSHTKASFKRQSVTDTSHRLKRPYSSAYRPRQYTIALDQIIDGPTLPQPVCRDS
jgi:hypothetical protein